MIKNKIFLFVFAAFIISHFTACAQVKDLQNRLTAYNRIDLTNINERILQLVNEHRRTIGKTDLKMIDVASAQAAQHSRDMMNKTTPFGHEQFDERVDVIKKEVGFINAAGENVAYGKLTADEVVNGWLHSPGHRQNIEGDYNLTGIGVAQNSAGVIYFTQIFVLKK